MKLENNDLIEEFFEQNKFKYPTLTLEQFKEISFTPWKFLKQEMESGELPTVRLKYFGTFQVYEGRAKRMLENLKNRFKYHKIEPKQYFSLKEMLEKFLEKNESKEESK